ncbi:hypothetical protein BAME_30910 [Bacillus sp. M 2-6]|nr:hypothetical protein BAME_30910 [Bacillus sp. M 2-6]
MCLIMARTSILFNPILEMIGWENKKRPLEKTIAHVRFISF